MKTAAMALATTLFHNPPVYRGAHVGHKTGAYQRCSIKGCDVVVSGETSFCRFHWDALKPETRERIHAARRWFFAPGGDNGPYLKAEGAAIAEISGKKIRLVSGRERLEAV